MQETERADVEALDNLDTWSQSCFVVTCFALQVEFCLQYKQNLIVTDEGKRHLEPQLPTGISKQQPGLGMH